jgi:hypothetical protein
MRQVAKIRKALDKQQSITVVLLNYKKDRTPFWNLLSIDPLRGSRGGVVGFIGVQKNVSDIVHFYKRRVKPTNRTSTRPGEMGHLVHPHAAGACEALLNGTMDDAASVSEGKGDAGAARPSFNYSFGQAATGPPPAYIPGCVSSLPSVSLPSFEPIPLHPMEPMECSGGSTMGSMGGSGEGSTGGSSGGNDQTQSLSSSRSVDSEYVVGRGRGKGAGMSVCTEYTCVCGQRRAKEDGKTNRAMDEMSDEVFPGEGVYVATVIRCISTCCIPLTGSNSRSTFKSVYEVLDSRH